MNERTEDAQTLALRAFLLLCEVADDWRGKLVLVRNLGAEGRAVSLAAGIAGAACLAIEPDPAFCRVTLRAGACDFVVNTVDEALRILKNEIRKQKPVSVALHAAELPALEELASRGVAPQAYVVTMPGAALAPSRFADFGARIVRTAGALESGTLTEPIAVADGLSLHEFHFETAEALRDFDRRLVSATLDAGLRRRWASLAPSVFYRERPFRRVALLTRAELARLNDTPV